MPPNLFSQGDRILSLPTAGEDYGDRAALCRCNGTGRSAIDFMVAFFFASIVARPQIFL